MPKKNIGKEVSHKSEKKFKISNISAHVSMFFKKFRVGKNTKTKFYEKRGR